MLRCISRVLSKHSEAAVLVASLCSGVVMTDCRDAGAVLAECLGIALNPAERSLESFLEGTVDGFVALREVGVDEAVGRKNIHLFIYDHLKRVRMKDDIKVRPNVFLARSEICSQLKRLLYDRYFVVEGDQLVEVPKETFKALLFQVRVTFLDVDTTDYFYV